MTMNEAQIAREWAETNINAFTPTPMTLDQRNAIASHILATTTPLPGTRLDLTPTGVPVTEDAPEPAPTQPEDVKPDPQPGEAWLIEYEGRRYEAVYWYSPLYAHWAFVENREGLKTVESPEATPVSRLVPERGDVS